MTGTPRLGLVGFASVVFLGAVPSLAATGCEKEATKRDDKAGGASANATSAAASASASGTAVSTAATTSGKPQLAIDDTAAFVAGQRVETNGPDPKGAIVAALFGKQVEGETLILNAARDTKMPKIVSMLSALVAKKAKGVVVHTPLRDRSPAEILFSTSDKPSDCSAVATISREGAISTWPVSGATAERFTRGMAGPDLTRGSEGVRKRVLACDSPVWFVSADDSVAWGLVFDLARAVMHPEDAGLPKARVVSVLLKSPVAGRKVEVDFAD